MKLKSKILSCLLIIFFSSHVLATFSNYLEELDGESEYTMSGRTKERLISSYKNDMQAIHGAALDSKHHHFNTYKKSLFKNGNNILNKHGQHIHMKPRIESTVINLMLTI
jgi:hypothetical protein